MTRNLRVKFSSERRRIWNLLGSNNNKKYVFYSFGHVWSSKFKDFQIDDRNADKDPWNNVPMLMLIPWLTYIFSQEFVNYF